MKKYQKRMPDKDHTEKIIKQVLAAGRPVVLFGASGMLSFILDNLEDWGIIPEYICDNAPEKEGLMVKGIEVISFPVLLEQKKEYTVLLSVNSINARTAIKAQLAESHQFPYVYDLELFYPIGEAARKLVAKNKKKIAACFEFLEDAKSKEIFERKIRYCMEKQRDSLVDLEESHIYFPKDLFSFTEEVFVDAGAYNGDDTANMLRYGEGKIKAYIFEPEHHNAEGIKERFKDHSEIQVIEAGLARKTKPLYFSNNGESMMGGKIDQKGDCVIDGIALDGYPLSEKITYLKMDIEGGEIDALKGMKALLKSENAPDKLAISVYHHISHHWEIPLLIKKYNENYKLYYRHYGPGGCDTVLYAKKC
jgi:FkbM family methyltransferase